MNLVFIYVNIVLLYTVYISVCYTVIFIYPMQTNVQSRSLHLKSPSIDHETRSMSSAVLHIRDDNQLTMEPVMIPSSVEEETEPTKKQVEASSMEAHVESNSGKEATNSKVKDSTIEPTNMPAAKQSKQTLNERKLDVMDLKERKSQEPVFNHNPETDLTIGQQSDGLIVTNEQPKTQPGDVQTEEIPAIKQRSVEPQLDPSMKDLRSEVKMECQITKELSVQPTQDLTIEPVELYECLRLSESKERLLKVK